jgi:hypothetical protein
VTLDRARRRAACALFGAAAVCAWRAAHAQAQGLGLASESAVKAAFLYKFGGFVEWPPDTFRSPSAPFVIGVFGDDAVAAELERLTRGREVNGHPVAVVRVKDGDDLTPLHLLYAGGPRESRVRELLASVRGPVLTVADSALTGRAAPVLSFTQDEGRLRFAASLTAANARGLKLSSKLLAVAQSVEGR